MPRELPSSVQRFSPVIRRLCANREFLLAKSAFDRYESRNEANFVYASRLGTVADVSGIAGFRLPMKPTIEYHDSLERMKLYAGSQSRDEPYCQDHGGDNPSPAAFDFGHLEFAAGDARAKEQGAHPRQP
jgi:hypothetical protein